MENLKPCPFCGGAPVMRYTKEKYAASEDGPSGAFFVSHEINCHECGISLVEEYEDDACAKWNTRAALSKAEGREEGE